MNRHPAAYDSYVVEIWAINAELGSGIVPLSLEAWLEATEDEVLASQSRHED